MKRFFLGLISFYRRYLSGLKRTPSCRFYPSCSMYTYRAIEEWGIMLGILMGAWRILRCNPLCKGGVDHVPLSGAKKRSAEGYTVFYSRSPFGRYCVGSGKESCLPNMNGAVNRRKIHRG